MSLTPKAKNRRRRILLVEDNDDSRNGLKRCLELSNYEVDAVADGASALAWLRLKEPPDFLLIDLQLPDIDGVALAQQARLLAPQARLALISGWVIDGHLEKLPEPSPVDWLFEKPINLHQLLDTLSHADREGPTTPSTPEVSS
ncbi:hypothetical protein BH23PLA1_BH23PLA1_28080 [soil metagenome]